MKMATGGKCKVCHNFFAEMSHNNNPIQRSVGDNVESKDSNTK